MQNASFGIFVENFYFPKKVTAFRRKYLSAVTVFPGFFPVCPPYSLAFFTNPRLKDTRLSLFILQFSSESFAKSVPSPPVKRKIPVLSPGKPAPFVVKYHCQPTQRRRRLFAARAQPGGPWEPARRKPCWQGRRKSWKSQQRGERSFPPPHSPAALGSLRGRKPCWQGWRKFWKSQQRGERLFPPPHSPAALGSLRGENPAGREGGVR